MRDESDWHARQLEEASDLLDEANVALQQGRLDGAEEAVDEALVIVEMAEAENQDEATRKLRVRALDDRGLIAQHRDQVDRARELHERAAEKLDTIDDYDDEFAGTAASVRLNVAQASLFTNDYVGARESVERGLEIVDDLVERTVAGSRSLAIALYQTKAGVEAESEHFEEAEEATERAVELAESLADEGSPSALGQAARACQQVSVALFEEDKTERALDWGQRAESFSEATFDELGEPALPLYVDSQRNLIWYYEDLNRFADAEDALWKAIDVVGPDPDLVERGLQFYEECRKQADDRLEEGDLPRDEVEMGYEDLQDVIEDAGVSV